jgi:hypothetical protein
LSAHQNRAVIDRWLKAPALSELNVLTAVQVQKLASGLREGKQADLTEAMIVLSAESWLQGRAEVRSAHRQRQLAKEDVSLQVSGKEVRK